MTTDLKTLIEKRFEFDNSPTSKLTQFAIEYCDEFLCSEGKCVVPTSEIYAGARWQHNQLKNEVLPILLECVEALENLQSLVDTDHMISISEGDEKEYWVSDSEVQSICEEALERLRKWSET